MRTFDLALYVETISRLEERREELKTLWIQSNRTQSITDRLMLIDQEIKDLYDIVGYLSSRVPRSNIFLEDASMV